MPVGASSFREALRWGTEIYHLLHDVLGSRVAKYNQLLRIEQELRDSAKYPGKSAFYNMA